MFKHFDNNWEVLYEGSVERLLGVDADERTWAVLDGETAIAPPNISVLVMEMAS
jgi:hypothetical protein